MIQIPLLSAKPIALAIGAMFLVVACSSAADPTPAPATTAPGASPDGDTAVLAPDPTPEPELGFRDIAVTDAVTGEEFTLASLEGSVVAVEPFAVWCTNCHIQQDNVKQAYADLEAAGVRFVSLGVEPSEDLDRISTYRERRGYEWTFARAPVAFSRALADTFGPQILAVPATPLIILDEEGEVVFNDVGFHGPDSLREIFGEITP